MNPALPLATDVPIACGQFVAAQMPMPEGPADTGVQAPAAGTGANALVGGVLGLLAVAAAGLGLRRRAASRR